MPKEVQTVTTFLESDGEILILLRSQHVRTFKGVWGAVSGMIDNGRNPDEQALVEIEEGPLPIFSCQKRANLK